MDEVGTMDKAANSPTEIGPQRDDNTYSDPATSGSDTQSPRCSSRPHHTPGWHQDYILHKFGSAQYLLANCLSYASISVS